MKFCRKCGVVSTELTFYPSRSSKDGYSHLCRECSKANSREYFQTPKGIYQLLKANAKKKLIGVHISSDEFLQWYTKTPDRCYYCNIDLKDYNYLRNFIKSYPGTNECILRLQSLFSNPKHDVDRFVVDRVDFDQPYSKENLAKQCWFCTNIGTVMNGSHIKSIAPIVMSELKNKVREREI